MLGPVFRAKFVAGLHKASRQGEGRPFRLHRPELANPKQFAAFVKSLFNQQWVVYAKPSFGAPTLVLRYLGRYTHRVALSNHRLLVFDGERVTFRWKNGKVCGRSTRPLVRLYLCLRPLGGRLR